MNDEFDDNPQGDDSDRAAFYNPKPAGGVPCPRCGMQLIAHPSGERIINPSQMFPRRGQEWGVRAGPFDTSTEEGRRDHETFRPGVLRCMDFTACLARAAAQHRAEWLEERRPADPESEFMNPRLRWVDVGELDRE